MSASTRVDQPELARTLLPTFDMMLDRMMRDVRRTEHLVHFLSRNGYHLRAVEDVRNPETHREMRVQLDLVVHEPQLNQAKTQDRLALEQLQRDYASLRRDYDELYRSKQELTATYQKQHGELDKSFQELEALRRAVRG